MSTRRTWALARRRRYSMDPVAARQRKVFVQSVGLTLLVGLAASMVFLAITAR